MSLCAWVKKNSIANSYMYIYKKKCRIIEVGTVTMAGLTQTGYKPQVLSSCSSYHYN